MTAKPHQAFDAEKALAEARQPLAAWTRRQQVEEELERVTAMALAMRHSTDVSSITEAVFHSVEAIGLFPNRCGTAVWLDKDAREIEVWTVVKTPKGDMLEMNWSQVVGERHPLIIGIYEAWLQKKDAYAYVLEGADLDAYMETITKDMPFSRADWPAVDHMYFHFCPARSVFGSYLMLYKPLPEDMVWVLRKISDVFDLSYTRYLDLQQAEARAREATRTASLDRVRAEIASMRTADDLQRITPLIWRELTTLGVPFFRCGVFIVNEASEHLRGFLANQQGVSLAALDLPYDSSSFVRHIVDHWRRGNVYTEVWDRQRFVEWTHSMLEMGQIESPEQYQGAEAPPASLALQFVPFTQGMLYVGSAAPLAPDEIDLVQAVAQAFAMAYARYEDFQRLEAKNVALAETLDELRTTQQQLIQQEKMASLGALTAGIAHEIKNPLNFVKNFAEVNIELADELREGLEQGEDVQALLDDLKMTAAQIVKHGRRADGIVKSMMQHASGGTGRREPTDVNALVKEYLNLAYHGKRAQAPGYTVVLEHHLAPDVGAVPLVAQEIGRVLLNLLNNAFDAVHEKHYTVNGLYEPTVSVYTRKAKDQVEIRVCDNGPGIPTDIKDKLFEPFFTTKPTGSGTGLGLSLAYDIVTQGHGGLLAVESTNGEGATFIITLPA